MVRLADGKLDRVGCGFHESFHRSGEIFDALKEAAFVEKSVIHGDVETLSSLRIEKAMETKFFHDGKSAKLRPRRCGEQGGNGANRWRRNIGEAVVHLPISNRLMDGFSA